MLYNYFLVKFHACRKRGGSEWAEAAWSLVIRKLNERQSAYKIDIWFLFWQSINYHDDGRTVVCSDCSTFSCVVLLTRARTVITSCPAYVGRRWWEPFVARSLLAIFLLELRGGLYPPYVMVTNMTSNHYEPEVKESCMCASWTHAYSGPVSNFESRFAHFHSRHAHDNSNSPYEADMRTIYVGSK